MFNKKTQKLAIFLFYMQCRDTAGISCCNDIKASYYNFNHLPKFMDT